MSGMTAATRAKPIGMRQCYSDLNLSTVGQVNELFTLIMVNLASGTEVQIRVTLAHALPVLRQHKLPGYGTCLTGLRFCPTDLNQGRLQVDWDCYKYCYVSGFNMQ